VAVIVFLLAALSVVFAASVSADGPPEADSADDQHVTTDELSGADAVGDAPAARRPESPPGLEPPMHRDPTVRPTGNELSATWPWPWSWLESKQSAPEPGHDKCKRQEPWQLPTWCFGSSSWPVLRAQAVNATVTGIRGVGSVHPPTRRKHS
jgi:hypothetical protein